MTKTDSDNSNKKKVAAAAVAAAMLAGGVTAQADLQQDDKSYLDALNQKPVVQMIDNTTDGQVTAQDSDVEKKAQQKEMRQKIAKVLLAPVYAIGAVFMKLFDLVATGVLAPAAMVVLNWLIFAAVITGVLAVCLKVAFPNIPLRKMLTKRGIIFILISSAVISAACEVIPLIWPDAGLWVFVLRIAGGLAIMLPIFATVLKFIVKRKRVEGQPA